MLVTNDLKRNRQEDCGRNDIKQVKRGVPVGAVVYVQGRHNMTVGLLLSLSQRSAHFFNLLSTTYCAIIKKIYN